MCRLGARVGFRFSFQRRRAYLGALEASPVLALGAFDVPAGTGIVVAFVMRARDLLFGSAGLLIAAATTARLKSETRPSDVLLGEGAAGGPLRAALQAETVSEERHV